MELSWKEGKYFDLWILAHFFFGSTLGTFLVLFKIPEFYSYSVAVISIFGWEIIESALKIKEHNENKIIDIILGLIGFMLGYHLPNIFSLSSSSIKIVFLIQLIILLILGFIGWINYKKHIKGT